MDPDANLEEQRRLIVRNGACGIGADDTDRLCDLVEALDDWILAGGALPKAWQKSHMKRLTWSQKRALDRLRGSVGGLYEGPAKKGGLNAVTVKHLADKGLVKRTITKGPRGGRKVLVELSPSGRAR